DGRGSGLPLPGPSVTTGRKLLFLLLATAIATSVLGAWAASTPGRAPWLVAILVFVPVAAAGFAARSMVSGLVSSIEHLTKGTERGDPSLGTGSDRENEVTRLAVAFERLRASLVDEIAKRDDERELLRSVIAGMKEGLLLVGPDRRIRLANDAFR